MSFRKKKENNFSIISNVSFTSDTTMLKYFLYKNFHLFPMSRQPMQPFLSFLLWSNFSKYIIHFSILCPLLSHNSLSAPISLTVSQSPLASFQIISSNFLKYVTLVLFILVDLFRRHHIHLKILLNLIISLFSPICKHSPEGSLNLSLFLFQTVSSAPVAANTHPFCIYLLNFTSHLSSRPTCQLTS